MLLLLLSALLCAPLTAAPQAEPSPPVLTEDLVVAIALGNNPAMALAEAEAGMARARLQGSRSEQTVQVSANALATLSNMGSVIQIPGVMPQAILGAQDKTSADLNLMAMVPLSTGGRVERGIEASGHDLAAFEAQLVAARVQVAFEARMRFADWQAAVASAKVAGQALDVQAEQVRISEQMVDVGKVPLFDLLRNQAALSARQLDLANAEADVTVAKARMAQVLGTAVESFSEPANESREALPEDLLAAALAQRPDLAAARSGLAKTEAVVDVRKASYKPQVYGVGMLDVITPSGMGDSLGVSVGVAAGIPLSDGGRRRAEVAEAQQDVLRARATVSAAELLVRAEVTSAQARLAAALQNITTAAAQVVSAEEGYRVGQIRYGAEKSTVVELLDTLQALTEARQNLVKAKAGLSGAYAEMYRALGITGPGKDRQPLRAGGPR